LTKQEFYGESWFMSSVESGKNTCAINKKKASEVTNF